MTSSIKTTVINLLAGPGAGKSTTAAQLYYTMKSLGLSCEQVQEFVKTWAWMNIKPKMYDQVYIFGQQAHKESVLYENVRYVVTDSPLLLSSAYETFYQGDSVAEPSVLKFLQRCKDTGIEHRNYFLKRSGPFDPKGRYETEIQAKKFDAFLEKYLDDLGVQYTTLDIPDRARVIMEELGL